MGIQFSRGGISVADSLTPEETFDRIAGMRLWLKADALSLANNDPVSTWTDSGPNAYSPTNTGTARPTFITNAQNGLPVLRFDQSNDCLDFADTAQTMMGSSAAGTVFTVHKASSDGDGVNDYGSPIGQWGSASNEEHWPFRDGDIYANFGSTTRRNVGNPAATMVTQRIYCQQTSASVWRLYIDGGTAFYTTGTNTVGWRTASAPAIGRSIASPYFFGGDIAEVLIYDTALTAAQMNLVGIYLANKWAVTWNSVP